MNKSVCQNFFLLVPRRWWVSCSQFRVPFLKLPTSVSTVNEVGEVSVGWEEWRDPISVKVSKDILKWNFFEESPVRKVNMEVLRFHFGFPFTFRSVCSQCHPCLSYSSHGHMYFLLWSHCVNQFPGNGARCLAEYFLHNSGHYFSSCGGLVIHIQCWCDGEPEKWFMGMTFSDLALFPIIGYSLFSSD